MEKKTSAVRINHGKLSAIRKFERRHPKLYSIASIITVMAAIAIIGALINWAVSSIPGNSQAANPGGVPPAVSVPFPAAPASRENTSPPADTSTKSDTSGSQDNPPDPPPAVAEPSPTPTSDPSSDDAEPYSSGSCLSGDFNSSTPQDVQQVSCSSDHAYEILEEYPDETDPNVCKKVEDAELGYVEEYTENGAVVSSYVYCLGPVGQL
jgi:hypothetical protein